MQYFSNILSGVPLKSGGCINSPKVPQAFSVRGPMYEALIIASYLGRGTEFDGAVTPQSGTECKANHLRSPTNDAGAVAGLPQSGRLQPGH